MRTIILAAGEGKRLRPYTKDRPKCLVELAGVPLLLHQTDVLSQVGITDVTIVTGYHAEQMAAMGWPTRHNPDYARTNMVASLMCAADLLDGADDVLIGYADIVYEPRVIEALCECRAPLCTTVDESWHRLWRARFADPLSEAETLRLDETGHIHEIGRKAVSYDQVEAQYMGLIKARADVAPELVATYRRIEMKGSYDGRTPGSLFMTDFLQYLVDHGRAVRPVLVDGGWLEVDTAADLDLYNRLHRSGRLSELCRLTAEASTCGQAW